MAQPISARASEDAALIERLRHGDLDAYRTLIRTYADPLADYVYTIVQADAMPQDIVQDVFIWLWDSREKLDIHGNVAAYLMRAARNTALTTLRHERSQQRIARETHNHTTQARYSTNTGPDQIAQAELSTAINNAIQDLSPRLREALLLHTDHSLAAPEIADLLGVTPATVHSMIYRATSQLAKRLKPWL